ncbi:hypothetical protein ACFW81_21625 [Streptomyces angustmyceticus]|uniref:hypothetical protein n=1 Tax=Streptomyces angustmyceticus TaxID=285578 RepID=UPI003687DF9B
MMKTRIQMKVRGEGVMWASMAVCLIAALLAPLFGDDPKAIAIPCAVAMVIAGGIAWLRKRQVQ